MAGKDEGLRSKLEELISAVEQVKDADGRERIEMFVTLPTKRELPMYYKVIKNPIDVDCVKKKLEANKYDSLESLRADFRLMFENARTFNTEDSEIYEDALALEKEMEAAYKRLISDKSRSGRTLKKRKKGDDDEADTDTDTDTARSDKRASQQSSVKRSKTERAALSSRGKGTAATPSSATKTGRTSKVKSASKDSSAKAAREASPATGPGPSLNSRATLTSIIEAVRRRKTSRNRYLAEVFEELPSKKELPVYYDVIKKPIDIKAIEAKVAKGAYTLESFVADMDLMFENAQFFNEPSSLIHKDAGALKQLVHDEVDKLKKKHAAPPPLKLKLTAQKTPEKATAPTPRSSSSTKAKKSQDTPAGSKKAPVASGSSTPAASADEERLRKQQLEMLQQKLGDQIEQLKKQEEERRNRVLELGVVAEKPPSTPSTPQRRQPHQPPPPTQQFPAAPSATSASQARAVPTASQASAPKGPIHRPRPFRFPSDATLYVLVSDVYRSLGLNARQFFRRNPKLWTRLLNGEELQLVKTYLGRGDVGVDSLIMRYDNLSQITVGEKTPKSAKRKESMAGVSPSAKSPLTKGGITATPPPTQFKVDLPRLGPVTPKDKLIKYLEDHKHKFVTSKHRDDPSVLKEKCMAILDTIYNIKDDKGEGVYLSFWRLPSRKDLPDYYVTVSEPMDLFTVHNQVKQQAYTDAASFAYDVALVFNNAAVYNDTESELVKTAERLFEEFRQLCNKHFTPQQLVACDSLKSPTPMQRFGKALLNQLWKIKSKGKLLVQEFIALPDPAELKEYYHVISTPIALSTIHERINRRHYGSLERLQQDFFVMCENCRVFNDPSSQVYKDSIALQKAYIKHRTDLAHEYGIESPALQYTEAELMTDLQEDPRIPEDDTKVLTLDSIDYNGTTYHVGEHVLIRNKLSAKQPHVCVIEGLWRLQDGTQLCSVSMYYRPEESFHVPTRVFYKQEVLASKETFVFKMSRILRKCHVFFIRDYLRYTAPQFDQSDVFVCESRYSSKEKRIKPIKQWVPPKFEVETKARDKVLDQRHLPKVKSVFASAVAESSDTTTLDPRCEIDDKQPKENRTCYKVFFLDGHEFRKGDIVYVQSGEDLPYIAEISNMWTDDKQAPWFEGVWYFRPSETKHSANRKFYKRELLRGSTVEVNPMRSILGQCCVLNVADYKLKRPVNLSEEDVYVCRCQYSEVQFLYMDISPKSSLHAASASRFEMATLSATAELQLDHSQHKRGDLRLSLRHLPKDKPNHEAFRLFEQEFKPILEEHADKNIDPDKAILGVWTVLPPTRQNKYTERAALEKQFKLAQQKAAQLSAQAAASSQAINAAVRASPASDVRLGATAVSTAAVSTAASAMARPPVTPQQRQQPVAPTPRAPAQQAAPAAKPAIPAQQSQPMGFPGPFSDKYLDYLKSEKVFDDLEENDEDAEMTPVENVDDQEESTPTESPADVLGALRRLRKLLSA